MRVLHAIHDFLPRHMAGSEIYTFRLCRHLADWHDVSVLCAEYDPARPHGHVQWRLHDGLPVVEIANNWTAPSFRDTYDDSTIDDSLGHVLQALQPDVVHIHSLLNLSFALPALARQHGARVVATLHDYTLMCPSGGQRIHVAERHVCHTIDAARCVRCFRQSPFGARLGAAHLAGGALMTAALRTGTVLARRFPRTIGRLAMHLGRAPTINLTPIDLERRLDAARAVFEHIDVVVAPSQSMAVEFERFGVAPSKIRTSDYGFVPVARSAPAPPRTRLRVGYVGTLVWHKGVHALIEAVRRLPPEAFELKIFGDPTVFPAYAADLRKRSDGLPIRFMGGFDPRDVAKTYSQFDVLVVPSLWLENSPLVIHEAFLAGRPVVGARIGGIAELIDHGRTGLLYEPTSVAELEAALRSLIDSPRRLHELTVGAQTLPRVRSIGEDASGWDAIYRGLVA